MYIEYTPGHQPAVVTLSVTLVASRVASPLRYMLNFGVVRLNRASPSNPLCCFCFPHGCSRFCHQQPSCSGQHIENKQPRTSNRPNSPLTPPLSPLFDGLGGETTNLHLLPPPPRFLASCLCYDKLVEARPSQYPGGSQS